MDYTNSPKYLDSFAFNPPNYMDNQPIATTTTRGTGQQQYSAMSNIPIETPPDNRFRVNPTTIPQYGVPTLTTGNEWGYKNRFVYNNGRTNGGRTRIVSRRHASRRTMRKRRAGRKAIKTRAHSRKHHVRRG